MCEVKSLPEFRDAILIALVAMVTHKQTRRLRPSESAAAGWETVVLLLKIFTFLKARFPWVPSQLLSHTEQ